MKCYICDKNIWPWQDPLHLGDRVAHLKCYNTVNGGARVLQA